jgi:hypothetical protein
MKRAFLLLSILAVVTAGCDLSVTIAQPTSPAPLPTDTLIPAAATPTQIPATQVPTPIPASATPIPATPVPTQMPPTPVPPTAQPPASAGGEVSVGPLTIFLWPDLASGARGSQFSRAEGQNVAPWDVTPGHTQLKLEGYPLQSRSLEPQIYVYPALDYAVMLPGAFESIHRLDNILYGPGGSISADQLPTVPFFNAAQLFASNVQLISFQNGGGVRFLTEYAQYPASVNNHDLFYHFEGVSRDGEYYIVAILPISAPGLAETSDPGAALPSGGIPYPYYADPEADMDGYYAAVTSLLNGTSAAAFVPTLDQLDALIQSIRISP